jgi:hypothetical protein
MQWLKKHKNLSTAVVLLLLLVLWLFGAFAGDPQIAKVHALREQLRGEEAKKLTPEQRRDLWKQFGQEMKHLSPAQRHALSKDSQRGFENKIKSFFALPKKEQLAHLDQEINRQEAMRKKWEQKKPGKGPGGPGKGFSKGPSADPQQREHRRKERLEHSTPEQRAMFSEYARLLKERRQQRGLPTSPRGPGTR